MFAFALKMLWEAWRMGEGELEETQKEVEQELAELDDGQPQVDNLPGIQYALRKKLRDYLGIFPIGGGRVFPIPKTFVN